METQTPLTPVPVGILGATGTVGQIFLQLLEGHPYFKVVALAASDRSAGKLYQDVVQWKQSGKIPRYVRNMPIGPCTVQYFTGCGTTVVFSALDSSVAGEIETEFADAGFAVFSNARNHRMDPLVPICIPTINPAHIEAAYIQKMKHNSRGGFIVTNANCSTTGLATVLKPLDDFAGIEKVFVSTMQAISGAGYPGVASMDIVDNVVPFISGEEDKMEIEAQKILGTFDGTQFQYASFVVSAHCNRVPVLDGHTENVSIKFKKEVTPEQVAEILKNYRPDILSQLPSAPANVIEVLEEQDRPQPRLDRDRGRGFTVTVGRIRKCNLFDIKLTLLLHNTVIGAAGASILNAELARVKGWL